MTDLDEGFLKLTNHKDHPTNKAYKVFFFYEEIQAEFFENILKEKNIPFEKDEENTNNGKVFLFGIRKSDNREVTQLNYLTLGKFRTPFIAKKWVQYLIIIFGFLLVIFAVISYMKNKP